MAKVMSLKELFYEQPAACVAVFSMLTCTFCGCSKTTNNIAVQEVVQSPVGNLEFPWKRLGADAIRESVESNHWIFLDGEGLSIRGRRSETTAYRNSSIVIEKLNSAKVHCYLFPAEQGLEGLSPEDIEDALSVLIELTRHAVTTGEGDDIIGYFFHSNPVRFIPVFDGSEVELLEILDKIEDDRELQGD